MGAGLHGLNGLNPCISFKLWNTFVASQLYYGLEATGVTTKQIQKIEEYQTQLFRQMQHLPTKTPTAAVYLLLGAMPAEGVYERKLLTFICNLIRTDTTIEASLIHRQAAMKDLDSNSLVSSTRIILAKYNLPSIFELLRDPPGPARWKTTVKRATQKFWTIHLRHEARKCSSLKYINLDTCTVGTPHPLWSTTSPAVRDTTRATVKAKLVTGSYTLQCHRAIYSRPGNKVAATCQLCQNGVENREHFLTTCAALSDVRSPYINNLREIVLEATGIEEWCRLSNNNQLLTQLILDPTSPSITIHLYKPINLHVIEHCTRRLCFALHCERSRLLGICTQTKPTTKLL
jgi:hypothetical protein